MIVKLEQYKTLKNKADHFKNTKVSVSNEFRGKGYEISKGENTNQGDLVMQIVLVQEIRLTCKSYVTVWDA